MDMLTSTDWQALLLSARVAAMATVIALPVGFAVACLLHFGKFRGKAFLEGAVNLPLVLPPVVVGYLLLLGLGENGLGPILKKFGLSILFTWYAAVLAAMVVGFPLLVRAIRIGLEGIDPQLILASSSLGAGRFDTLFNVVLPMTRRSLLAGASLMFARSLGEFGATIMIAGNIPGVTQTIPLAIYDYSGMVGGERLALGLCLASIVLSFVVLIGSDRLTRFRREAGAS
ncbi:MAG: molybdate ABC transporter permease subunit [Deltaproteobacteria bacterium]|jgi:molybdate transport system permease protein|nr:molybdate ABC transporter permease subunit [Deltaproteobacteria bacterium]